MRGWPRCSALRPLLAIGFFLATCVSAQEGGLTPPVVPPRGQLHLPPNTRVIEGVVKDAHGVPIPGAIVLLKDTKTLQIRSYIAQPSGTYKFYGLSTDINYEVRAETKTMTSKDKLVSVFDSHKVIKVNLTVKDKKKDRNS